MTSQPEFFTREDYNAELTRNDVVATSEMMPLTTHINAMAEAAVDQNLQSKGRKPVYDYSIPHNIAVVEHQLLASQRVGLRALHENREVTSDPNVTHNYELPKKQSTPEDIRLSTLKQRRREANPLTYNPDHIPRDYRSENLGIHFDNYGTEENETFTRTKLLNACKYEEKLEEDELKDKFVEIRGEMHHDSDIPFWQRDSAFHYDDSIEEGRERLGTFSQKEIELIKTGKIENKELEKPIAHYESLSKQRKEKLEAELNQPRLAEIDPKQYDENLRTLRPKRTHFATAVLKQKNPDWQLLRVKSTMTGDEDKPLYSSFAPDGFYRELLMPQIRAPSRGSRQVPQQLRGMVRVMQLPIVSEVSELLDTENDRLPGDTRILTRPNIFE